MHVTKTIEFGRLLAKYERKTISSKQQSVVFGRSFEKAIGRKLRELSFLRPISKPIRIHLRHTCRIYSYYVVSPIAFFLILMATSIRISCGKLTCALNASSFVATCHLERRHKEIHFQTVLKQWRRTRKSLFLVETRSGLAGYYYPKGGKSAWLSTQLHIVIYCCIHCARLQVTHLLEIPVVV